MNSDEGAGGGRDWTPENERRPPGRRALLRSLAGAGAATVGGGLAWGTAGGQTTTAAPDPPAPGDLVWDDATRTTASLEWSPPDSVAAVEYLQLLLDGEPVRELRAERDSIVIGGLDSETTYEVGLAAVGPDGTRSPRVTTTGTTARPTAEHVTSVSMDVAYAAPGEGASTDANVSIGGPDGQRVTATGRIEGVDPCQTYIFFEFPYEDGILNVSPVAVSNGSSDCRSQLVPTTFEATIQMNVRPRGVHLDYRGGSDQAGLPPAPTELDGQQLAPSVAGLSWEPVADPDCLGYAVSVDDEHLCDVGPDTSAVAVDGLDPTSQPIVGVTARYEDEPSRLVHRAVPLDDVSGVSIGGVEWSVDRSGPPLPDVDPGISVSVADSGESVTIAGRVAGEAPSETFVPAGVEFVGETLLVTVETRSIDATVLPPDTVPTGYEATIETFGSVGRVHVRHPDADLGRIWTDGDWRPPGVDDVRPTDPDGDGFYEDLNGNDRGDIGDAVTLFQNRRDLDSGAFDFNRSGGVEVADAVALFRENVG